MNAIDRVQSSAPTRMQPVLVPTTFDQLVVFADMAATSGLVPVAYKDKPGAIMIAVQMGSELGLSPMQSIQSIAVINGRPGVWGDGLIGLCRASPLCEDIVETIEGEGDARVATCTARRRGATAVLHSFSIADAKRAGLWGKQGPWTQYPDRMLQNRASGFALRDAFPDVLRGLKTVEELLDTPPDTFRGTTIEVEPVNSRQTATNSDKSRAANPPKSAEMRQSAEMRGAHPSDDATPKRTWRTLIDELRGMLTGCDTMDAVIAVADLPQVRGAIERGPMNVKNEVSDMLAEAYGRFDDQTHPEAEEDADPEDDLPEPLRTKAS